MQEVIFRNKLEKYVLPWKGICSCSWADTNSLIDRNKKYNKEVILRLKDIPEEALAKGNKQPLLIFTGLLSDRVQPHHSDDLVNIAIQNNIEYGIHKYTDMNHTQILYFYTEEYSELLTGFYERTLDG